MPWPDYHADAPDYLARLAEDVFTDLAWRLDESIAEVRAHAADREDMTHADFGASRRRLFQGRSGERRQLASYLAGPTACPLIVVGPGGVGKSALLALAAGPP